MNGITIRVRESDEVGKLIKLPEGDAIITSVNETTITYVFVTERQETLARLTGCPPNRFIP